MLKGITLHDFMSKDLNPLNALSDVTVEEVLDVKSDVGGVPNHPLEQCSDSMWVQQHVFVDLHVKFCPAIIDHLLERRIHRRVAVNDLELESAILLLQETLAGREAWGAHRRHEYRDLAGKIDLIVAPFP
jgi:hypothetical protein